jgi:oligoribonuclease
MSNGVEKGVEKKVPANLIWMDLEMTGLDPETDVIIEMATIVTDSELNILGEGPVLAISQPEAKLAGMDEWNTTHHNSSGLVERVRQSSVGELEAQAQTLAFIESHVAPNASPLCGNTIWQDRRFLTRYMPVLEDYLHYRNIDVSSLKELVARWRPELLGGFSKSNQHTALADIRESIEELKYYREHFIRLE